MERETIRVPEGKFDVGHEVREGVIGFHGRLVHGVTELAVTAEAHFLGRRMFCRPDVHFRGQQHVWPNPIAPDIVLSEILVAGRRVLDGVALRPSSTGAAGAYDIGLVLIQPGDEVRFRLVNFASVTLEFFATLHGESW